MPLHNFAAYKAGTFSIDISNLTIADKFFEQKDMPAFVHEYCHYIQDITTISSIFGFSLWMRDVVNMTRIFSDGTQRKISIPLDRDQYGETINKFRKYYNLYCGDPTVVLDIDYSKIFSVKRHLTIKDISLDGRMQKLAINEIELSGHVEKLFFGLIVLQEIQAFYAQQLAENKLPGVEFSIYSENLPSYPYKFGDFLFEQNKIEIDLESKFLLLDLCLDTVQATSVFLEVLELMKGGKFTYFGGTREQLLGIVDKATKKCSYSTKEALENILPDLKMWSSGPGRKYLSEALVWYVNQIETVYALKEITSATFFSMSFIMNWKEFALFFQCYPAPVYLKDGVLYRTVSATSEVEDAEFIKNFDAASTIWSHRILYDLLCSEDGEAINSRCQCPLFANCKVKEQLSEEYTCKMTPWEVIKGIDKAICQYGMAAHSFGLWQNTLEINL